MSGYGAKPPVMKPKDYRPDTSSGKMRAIIRYVTKQDPTKKAKLGVKAPGDAK